jgi:hypothetical protein
VPMDRAHFFSDYAQLIYRAAIAPDAAFALSGMAVAETDLQKVIGDQSMLDL